MSVDIYPAAPSPPLSVPAGTLGPPVAMTERAALDPVTARTLMLVRVVQISEGAPAPPPTIRLAVDGDPPTVVGSAATSLTVGGTTVATATVQSGTDDIHRIEIEVLQHGHTWALQIGNTGSRDHRYIWVVAATAAETLQPWLDVPSATVTLPGPAGAAAADITLANYGTGPLTLTDADGADLGTGFRLAALNPHTVAGNQRATARIEFTTVPGAATTTHVFASDDPAAGPAPGHNNRVELTASFPAWRSGDILVVNGNGLCGLDRATGALTTLEPSLTSAVDIAIDPLTGDALVIGPDLVRVDRRTGRVTRPPGTPALSTAPVGVVVNTAGTALVLDTNPDRLIRSDASAVVPVPGVDGARDIAMEASGTVVVVCGGLGNAKVLRIVADTGAASMIAQGGSLSGPVGGPTAVAVEHDGTLLAIRPNQGGGGGFTFSAGTLFRIDPHTHAVTLFLEHNTLFSPHALAVAGDGTILVCAGGGIFTLDPHSGAETTLTSTRATGIAVVPPLGG